MAMEAAVWTLIGVIITGGIAGISLVTTAIGKLGDRIDRLDAKIDSKVGALDAKIDAQGARLDSRIDALTVEVGAVQRELNGVNRTLGELVGMAHSHQSVA